MVTKRHLNGRKQTVSIRNFGHSITAPYFHSDTVTIRLFTYINGPYYCARKYGPYRRPGKTKFTLNEIESERFVKLRVEGNLICAFSMDLFDKD